MSATIEMTTIHPVERLAHRIGLALVAWSIGRAERRDAALGAVATLRGVHPVRRRAFHLQEGSYAAQAAEVDREEAWRRRALLQHGPR